MNQLKTPLFNHFLSFFEYYSYFRLATINKKFFNAIKENKNFKLMLDFYKCIKKLNEYSEFPNEDISSMLINNKTNYPLLQGFSDIIQKENINKIIIISPNENYERYKIILSSPFEINSFCLYSNKKEEYNEGNSFMIMEDPIKSKIEKLCKYINSNHLEEKIKTFEVCGYSSLANYIIRYLSCFTNVNKYIIRDITVGKYQTILNFKSHIENYNNTIKTVELYNTKQTYSAHTPFIIDIQSIKFVHTNASQLDFIFMSNYKYLTELYIDDNPNIDWSIVSKFIMIPTLIKLSIINCKLSNKDIIEIEDKNKISLKYFDISYNLLSNQGIIKLSKMISEIKSIEFVDVSHNLYDLNSLNRELLDKRIVIKD